MCAGLPVVLPEEGEAMLVGGAILAASAAGQGEVSCHCLVVLMQSVISACCCVLLVCAGSLFLSLVLFLWGHLWHLFAFCQ